MWCNYCSRTLALVKDYEIDICCFSAKHAVLRSKNNLWLAWNHSNASEWNNVSNSGMLFQ